MSDRKLVSNLRVEDKNKVCLGIIKAVAYIHSKSIIHRDLKPSNILLSEEYVPKICDFGSCIFGDSGDKPKTGFTPRWCAPEVSAGEKHTEKSDIYSIGLVYLYVKLNYLPSEDMTEEELLEIKDAGSSPDIPKVKEIIINDSLNSEANLRPCAERLLSCLSDF